MPKPVCSASFLSCLFAGLILKPASWKLSSTSTGRPVFPRILLPPFGSPRGVAALSDAFARVEVTFVDLDLDENHLGGQLGVNCL